MLSAVYIKGFKTFARPVRMPLEGGVTAIVGPNGSGKSNITDAVLFALGEQSPGVLRAGAMGDLIFSGSETLPPSAVAEVTLVLDNEAGLISLPYREVSISRRVSRGGDTEYRVNGSRARLADVRAVAGEAGLGRHSILRQGAVDAIVAGGAAACRLALEEAAGLGVYRRRRLSASRRLEKADVQLERSRQLEKELADQLHRIEREAVAAREYRETEGRYRRLSLAHLYRVATQGLDERRERLARHERRVGELSARQDSLHREEAALEPVVRRIETETREIDGALTSLEDATEDLRSESLRVERTMLRIEASAGAVGARTSRRARLEAERVRVSRALDLVERELGRAGEDHARRREEHGRIQRDLASCRERNAESEKLRARMAGDLEDLRRRHERVKERVAELSGSPEGYFEELSAAAATLENDSAGGRPADSEDLRRLLRSNRGTFEALASEVSRRQGTLDAARGRVEARIRSLRETEVGGSPGPRLHEVMRPKPGFEGAVEAALGEYAIGVLAENVGEGMKILSETERVALRLDARPLERHGGSAGRPLLECVELLDEGYAEAVERLLGGIYVIENPERDHPENGYVAVTRDGLRLTRTSVSLRPANGRFSREARLATERRRLEALKQGPGERLYDCRERLSTAARRLDYLSGTADRTSALLERTVRASAVLSREVSLRRSRAGRNHEALLKGREELELLRGKISSAEASLREATESAKSAGRDLARILSAAGAAQDAYSESERRLNRLRSAHREGRERQEQLSTRLDRLPARPEHDRDLAARLATRATELCRSLTAATRERRNLLRRRRAELAEEGRLASDHKNELSRRAVALAGELATARADAEHARQDLRQSETAASEASEEIQQEWAATLEDARREAEEHPPETEAERHRLARKLKRFGDVNLLALSQQETLRERHGMVAEQRADAEAAASELNRIIQSIDREIEARFSETFRRVKGAFGEMVPRMIEGAAGVLDLSEEGVEIGLRLGRKGWRPLHVLSGGERALLALSFLFSVFLSRSESSTGAFCILDEAEAALDDLNLARFIAVVDSYRSSGQFLLVTHQKRTMAAADVLYGVVQDAAGATTVVSKRMQGE